MKTNTSSQKFFFFISSEVHGKIWILKFIVLYDLKIVNFFLFLIDIF